MAFFLFLKSLSKHFLSIQIIKTCFHCASSSRGNGITKKVQVFSILEQERCKTRIRKLNLGVRLVQNAITRHLSIGTDKIGQEHMYDAKKDGSVR